MARCSIMCFNGNLIKVVEEDTNCATPLIEYRPFKDSHVEDSSSSESTSTKEPEVADIQDVVLMPVEDEQLILIKPSNDDHSRKKMDIEIDENRHQQAKISAVFSLNCLHEKEVTAPEVYIKEEAVESENEIMHLSSDESENGDRMLPDNESETCRKNLPRSSGSLNVKNSVSAESPSNVEEPDDFVISEVPDLIIMPVSPPEICIKQEPVESDTENHKCLPDKSESSEKGFLDSESVKNSSSINHIPSSSKRPHPEILDISEVPDLVMQPVDNLSQAELIDISKSLSAEESKNCPSSSSAASVPRNVFRGAYNFRVKFRPPKVSDRSPTSIYCELNKKLYVAKHQPFEVLICAQSVPPGAVIKVCAAFSKPDYQNEIVVRCPTHAQIDYLTGRQEYDHLVQCMSPSAFYLNNNGVRCVAVPYEAPPAGQLYTSYVYKLTCFSSCLGGVYKRPFQLLFTLEKDDTALGRYAVETRVCACPLRDSRNEIKKEMPDNEDLIPFEDIDVPEKKNYSITVTDPTLYQFLKDMQNLYEASSIAKKLKKT